MSASRTETLLQAYEQGFAAAQALAVGDVFTGAFGAADAAGFMDKGPERCLFVEGYVEGLPEVVTDRDGVVLSLKPKGGRA